MSYTALMCVYTAAHLPPLHQAYIRSAGTTGQQVYDELVSLRCAALYVELNPRASLTTEDGKCDDGAATNVGGVVFNEDEDGVDISAVISPSRYHAPVTKTVSRPDMSENDVLVFNADTLPAHRGLSLNAVKDICRRLHHPRNLKIANGRNLAALHDYFMENCNSLVTLQGIEFENVTKIGHSFMYGCTSLRKLNIAAQTPSSSDDSRGSWHRSGMHNLEAVGSSFLRNCAGLEEVDINVLFGGGGKLVSIGKDFMSDCVDLKSITMPVSLTNITTISANFMTRCTSLQNLSIKNLFNVGTIEAGFLSGCRKVEHIELDGLNHLTNIGEGFLMECSMVASLSIHRDATNTTTPFRQSSDNATTTKSQPSPPAEGVVADAPEVTTVEEEDDFVVGSDFLSYTNALTAATFYTDIPTLRALSLERLHLESKNDQ